jgi:hypothetical protein
MVTDAGLPAELIEALIDTGILTYPGIGKLEVAFPTFTVPAHLAFAIHRAAVFRNLNHKTLGKTWFVSPPFPNPAVDTCATDP